LAAALVVSAAPAAGYDVTDELEVWGRIQMLATLYEQNEAASVRTQHPSGDEAADITTGFSLSRARLGTALTTLDGLLGLEVELALERGVELEDGFVLLAPAPWLTFQFGQFKTPSTWENLASDGRLDFPDRTAVSRAVGDYSLSRAYYTASQLAGNRAHQRDLGIGAAGLIELGPVPLRYRLMVGNGLGANLWISTGDRAYGLSNRAQFFYGGRLELEPVPEWIAIGGHGSYNRHDDMLLGGSRVVVDLHRVGWSSDVRLGIPPLGLRLTGMIAGGGILEDYYGDGKDDLRYWGGEGRLVWRVTRFLRELCDVRFPDDHELEAAFRYDALTLEIDESGAPTREHAWSIGVNYLCADYFKAQLDYVLRRTDDPAEPDLDDDRLLLLLQGEI
jgi:hypothetical protein